jgi:hypothetical protein
LVNASKAGALAAAICIMPFTAHAEPHDARSVEAAHALAEAALNVEGANAGFENATTSLRPALRHIQSGALCRFWAEQVWIGAPAISYGRPIEPGSEVACVTQIALSRDRRWTLDVRIEAAPQGLGGARYREFDGDLTPVIVTPQYRARRTAYWSHGRAGPVQHDPSFDVPIAGGRQARVYTVWVMFGSSAVERIMTTLVDGWLVTAKITGPADQADEAAQIARDHIALVAGTITRPHAEAERFKSIVDAMIAEAAPPPSDPLIDAIHDAFVSACLRPSIDGASIDAAIAANRDWTPTPTRSGLPNILHDEARRVWRVPVSEGEVLIQRSAAMAGDCAVSAYGVDVERARRILNHRLTISDDAPFGLGFAHLIEPGVQSQQYDGRRWSGGATMITNTNADANRPALFIGLGPPLPR